MTVVGAMLRPVVDWFRHRPDSEHEQARIRLILIAVVFVYFQVVGLFLHVDALPQIAIFCGYELLSAGYVVWVAVAPGRNVARRIAAILTDAVALSLSMAYGGEVATPLYPLYLWVILGNGFRFGVGYMVASAVLSAMGFAAVGMTAPPWSEHPLLTVGLLSGLGVVPAYAASLIRKLTEAKVQAEAASRAKSRFLAIVSHELRTPLNAIIGMSDMLSRSRLDDDQLDMSRTIQVSGNALLSLIDTVLDFSRIEAGNTAIEVTEVDLHQGLAEVMAVMRQQAAGKGLDLSLTFGAAVPSVVRADWPHMRQVLTNLLANAVKFTEAGSVSLRVERIDTGVGPRLVCRVIDTGIGIPADKLESIFGAFVQADDQINRRFGGSGLGLTISRQLAELMGGGITVDSRPGRGSEFRFTLPVDVPETAERGPAPLHLVVIGGTAELTDRLAGLVDRLTGPVASSEALTILGAATLRDPVAVLAVEGADDGLRNTVAAAHHLDVPVILLGRELPGCPPPLAALGADPSAAELANAVRASAVMLRRGQPRSAVPVGERSRRPLTILVAEDNAVNVKVIRRILEKAGHQIEVVGSGDALLDAMSRGGMDLVIADVNMPGTPMIDAVKLYRMASLDRPRLPILALSADATLETRKACEEAGVDVYLIKPVVAATLLGAIDSLVPEPEDVLSFAGNVADLTRHPGFSGPTASPVDWAAVESLLQLGDAAMVGELIDEFLADAESLLQAMEADAAAGDRPAFRGHCHALRSSSANVGARGVARLCQPSVTGATDLTGQGHALCQRIRQAIHDYRSETARYLANAAPSSNPTRLA